MNAPQQTAPLMVMDAQPDVFEPTSAVMSGRDLCFARLYQAVLDEVDYGLILVRRSGEILFANRAALQSCANDDQPLDLEGWAIELRSSGDRERVHRALAEACAGRRSMVDLGTPAQRQCIAVVPLQIPMTPPMALLILGRHAAAGTLALQLFSTLHQLTPAEGTVLAALSKGLRPAQIANKNAVAVCTVRTQIRSIRQKTLTHSIGQLTRLIERLPPMALSPVSSAWKSKLGRPELDVVDIASARN